MIIVVIAIITAYLSMSKIGGLVVVQRQAEFALVCPQVVPV